MITHRDCVAHCPRGTVRNLLLFHLCGYRRFRQDPLALGLLDWVARRYADRISQSALRNRVSLVESRRQVSWAPFDMQLLAISA